MANAAAFVCSLCPHTTDSFQSFKLHYVRVHKNHPGFMVACSIQSCGYTTNTWGSFKVHMHRNHPNKCTEQDDDHDVFAEYENNGAQNEQDDDFSVDYYNTSFTLALQAEHNISQTAVNNIVSAADCLVRGHAELFRQQLKRKLAELEVDPNICDNIPIETLLDEFSTEPRRQTKYSKNLSTLVPPQSVCLGEKYVTKNGCLKHVSSEGFYVPLKQNLVNLLGMPEVWQFVQHPHHSREGCDFMHDVCDGAFMMNHPLFSVDSKALQLILNCDDLEIVNPIGTHVKKNKVTVFYFTLANIPPEFRSKLHAIQLVAIGKSKDVKSAVDLLLSDFVKTVNELSDGFDVNLFGVDHRVRGGLILVVADTLAANWLGGFKEGVSFALKNCRVCEIENKNTKSVCSESESESMRRSMETHRQRCHQLSVLSEEARRYWSKLWGINSASCLLNIRGFDMVSALVQDPMHVLLEGVALLELKHALFHFIYVQKCFSLGFLNSCISGFKYSYLHKQAKPAAVERQHLTSDTGSLKQTASGMMTLLQTLPVMLAHKVDEGDKNWINLMRLVQITNFCTSTYCTEDTAQYLMIVIAQYLYNYQCLYPSASFTPKMHYMIHLPNQMKMYGPLRHQWCMRFEGKNGYFSNKRYKNFKNLPLTLAKRHQLYMAYKQNGTSGGRNPNYLYVGDAVASGVQLKFSEVFPELVQEKEQVIPGAPDDVYMSKSVTIHGKEYTKGCALVLDYEEEEPQFGLLETVVVIDHVKYFVVKMMDGEFNLHILSYFLQPTGPMSFVSFSKLRFKWPLSVYTYQGQDVVMNSNSHIYAFSF